MSEDTEIQLGKFWQIASHINESLSRRVQNENEKFSRPLWKIDDESDKVLNFHYALSNSGQVDTKRLSNKLIKLESLFLLPLLKEKAHDVVCSNFLNTVNGKFCWTVLFNSHFIEICVIKMLVENLNNAIEETVKST